MKEGFGTKQKIRQAALSQFSQRGFHATSIRDIGGAVGIKESTVYYHYKNKQAIMDGLVGEALSVAADMTAKFDAAFSLADHVPEEAMCEVAVGILDRYLLSPAVRPVLSLLAIERMGSMEADRYYRHLVFELPLAQQIKVFGLMMEKNFIRENDPVLLAHEYYAAIYLAYQRHCTGAAVGEESIAMARREIEESIRDLYRKMKGVAK